MTINATKTYLPNLARYNKYVERIYNSGWITNRGELVRELEDRLKAHLNVNNVILVSNGSLALQVAYKALDLSKEVITTPFSFVATTSTLCWESLTPRFSDIDSKSLNLDPNLLEQKITDQTSALVPVHVYGNPCDTEKIQQIANKHKLKVIYDAAHAFGVTRSGRSILVEGDISAISFHATKLFHTIEGGALITQSDELAEKIRLMINFGISGLTTIDCLGINAKMNEFQAAMGLCMLDEVDVIIKKRQEIWEAYSEQLAGWIETPLFPKNTTRNYAYAPILLSSADQRERVENLMKESGIAPRRYFYPSLNTLGYVADKGPCPISEDASGRILCLPLYPGLENDIPIHKITDLVKSGIDPTMQTQKSTTQTDRGNRL